jgi:hypothetical protein
MSVGSFREYVLGVGDILPLVSRGAQRAYAEHGVEPTRGEQGFF